MGRINQVKINDSVYSRYILQQQQQHLPLLVILLLVLRVKLTFQTKDWVTAFSNFCDSGPLLLSPDNS